MTNVSNIYFVKSFCIFQKALNTFEAYCVNFYFVKSFCIFQKALNTFEAYCVNITRYLTKKRRITTRPMRVLPREREPTARHSPISWQYEWICSRYTGLYYQTVKPRVEVLSVFIVREGQGGLGFGLGLGLGFPTTTFSTSSIPSLATNPFLLSSAAE